MVEAKVAKPAKAVPAKKAEAKDDSAVKTKKVRSKSAKRPFARLYAKAIFTGYKRGLRTNTKTHLFFRLKAAPPKKTPGSTLERSVPSSTRARNPRSARSGVKLLALMVAQERFEPNSPQTS